MDNNNVKQNGILIIALGRAMQHLHQKSTVMLRINGLTLPQFTALEALYHKRELTVQQIIDSVLSTSGNMTTIIRNLEKQGLVFRMENPNDKRSFLIRITASGKVLMDKVFPLHMNIVGEKLAVLSSSEKELIIHQLKKI